MKDIPPPNQAISTIAKQRFVAVILEEKDEVQRRERKKAKGAREEQERNG